MKIITLSGTDGSGKSTHANFLQEYLESQGEKVYRFHAIEFSLANKFSKSVIARSKESATNDTAIQNQKQPARAQASFYTIILRKLLLLIDVIRFRMLLKKLNQKYDVLLSDRYFYDTVLNIYYLNSRRLSLRGARSLRRTTRQSTPFICSLPLIPKSDLALFLDVSPESVMRRHHTPEQGLEYLKQKYALFEKYAASWNMQRVNADDTKENVFLRVKSLAEKENAPDINRHA